MSRYTYTDQEISRLVITNTTYAGVIRGLGLKVGGGSHSNVRRRIQRLGLDTSHFCLPHSFGGIPQKKHWSEYLTLREGSDVRQQGAILRRALLESGRQYVCEGCGLSGDWQNKPLVLPVDHINGDWVDDRKENLRFLCPNCHSQTPNFGKKVVRECADCGVRITRNSKRCRVCAPAAVRRTRKVNNRPSVDILLAEVDAFGFAAVGRKYGVTDNAIRKWVKNK